MNSTARKEYLAALGLETWVVRTTPSPAASNSRVPIGAESAARGTVRAESAPREAIRVDSAARGTVRADTAPREAIRVDSAPREAAFDWAQLRDRVAVCTRCELSGTRTQTVFGVGNLQAEWLIVGEAPGAEEDRQGEPFVGRAGQLLNSMLRAIGLARDQVYIANVLKCRPPHNRDPLAGETVECLPYLERQIGLLKPKIMLVVGRIAAQNLLRTDVPLGRLRQQVHVFGESRVPLVVTYHPAYLLRTPADKRKAWRDLKFAREVLARG